MFKLADQLSLVKEQELDYKIQRLSLGAKMIHSGYGDAVHANDNAFYCDAGASAMAMMGFGNDFEEDVDIKFIV